MSEGRREKLKEFYFQIKGCLECELGKTRINFVFGSGNSTTDIVFIGEAPGKNEDLQGKPFVGQAGKILDELLLTIGFSRNDVFIANVLKCRPPDNRDPKLEEINICKKYLLKQIEIIDPKIICTMGKYSTQLILNTDVPITRLRGKFFRVENRIVLPINHPAAALYTPSRLGILKEDFQRIKMILDNYENPGNISSLKDIAGTEAMSSRGVTLANNKNNAVDVTSAACSSGLEAVTLLSDSDSGISSEKVPAVSAEPDLQKSKNEQLGLF